MASVSFQPNEINYMQDELLMGSAGRSQSAKNEHIQDLRLKLAEAVRKGNPKEIAHYAKAISNFEAAIARLKSSRM